MEQSGPGCLANLPPSCSPRAPIVMPVTWVLPCQTHLIGQGDNPSSRDDAPGGSNNLQFFWQRNDPVWQQFVFRHLS